MSFNNLYYKRTAGTAKACYVCYKPTTTVLATINTVDFLYACPGHLTDSGFASLVVDEAKSIPAAVSAEEIAKVKQEWEEKQKEADKGPKEVDKPTKTEPATVTHEQYILHRNFFTMRQAEHRRRRQATQAKELVPRLPSAPTAGV